MSVNPDAPVKLGVNGCGRIGRQVVRIAMEHPEFVVKHINSPMSPRTSLKCVLAATTPAIPLSI